MKEALRLKSWAGPVTIGTFAVVAVTGVMMFLHVNVGLTKPTHEVLGGLLIVGAIGHLVVNWRPFLLYFRKPAAIGIMTVLVASGALAILAGGGGTGHSPLREAFGALEQSTLGVVAQVVKTSPETLMDRLRAEGIRVGNAEQTLAQIAAANGRRGVEIVGRVMNP